MFPMFKHLSAVRDPLGLPHGSISSPLILPHSISCNFISMKDWKDVQREDIDECCYQIAQTYCDAKGLETHGSYDKKKDMRIFFRWFKTGNRVKNSQNDPEVYELQGIKMGKVKDRIAREDLFTEKDIEKLLSACYNSNRNKELKLV